MTTSTTIKKSFTDFGKEQEWLNQMSAEGEAFVSYHGGTYIFVKDEPGAWSYAIEILGQDRKGAESYLSFLEDTGIETVATYAGRAYLRKRNDGAPLELHSDLESRLSQAKKAGAIWSVIPLTQVSIALFLTISAFTEAGTSDLAKGITLVIGIILIVAAIIEYVHFGKPYRERIKQLKKELSIKE